MNRRIRHTIFYYNTVRSRADISQLNLGPTTQNQKLNSGIQEKVKNGYAQNLEVKRKGKVFPYSLPSVGPGADPGVQAVSPQVT